MQLQDIIAAWNAQADRHNQWQDLGADEMVEFTLRHVESEARAALNDLCISVYSPEQSGISVAHAIGHVEQIFSA